MQRTVFVTSIVFLALLGLTAMALAQNPACPNPYTVGPGDSWSVIASRCAVTVQELRAANPTLWRVNGVLYRGEQLTIPGQPSETSVPPDGNDDESVPYSHRVAPGESWSVIAKRYTVTFAELRVANSDVWNRRGENLRPGDELEIPGLFVGTPTPTPTASDTPTITPTPTASDTPTITPTATRTPTATITPTASNTPPSTATPTHTATPNPQVVIANRQRTQGDFGAAYLSTYQIDGIFNEWPVYPDQPVGHRVYNRGTFEGAADLSADFSVAWSDDGLLLAVWVSDQFKRAPYAGRDSFKNDSIEILFDQDLFGDLLGASSGRDDYQIVVSYGQDGAILYTFGDGFDWRFRSEVQAAFSALNFSYGAEILIPWATLGVHRSQVVSGQLFGFALSVADNDAESGGEMETMLSTSPNRNLSDDPTEWGTLALTGFGSSAGSTGTGACRSYALAVGDMAVVNSTPPQPNRVRSRPSTGGTVLGRLQPGEAMEILDGPVCANGWVWWYVQGLEQELRGWTAEGDGPAHWLLPAVDAIGWDNPGAPGFGSISVCLPDDFRYNSSSEEGYCRTGATSFSGNVRKLYFSWPYYNTPEGTRITRKFYRNDVFMWDSTNSAGEGGKRWSLSRQEGYVWVLIDAQYRDGRLWELFRSDYLPTGDYRMELYVNDEFRDEVSFSIWNR
ncbi:MAG: LysM peptidoglycan-binding domain-containing protein [Caldilineaceae bacterium]